MFFLSSIYKIRSASISMAARLLQSLKKTHIPFTHHFFSPSFFSCFCRNKNLLKFSIPPNPPPLAKKLPFTATVHGLTWQDPYRWMSENINDPDFIDYLNQENSYAKAFMNDTEEMRRTLYSEMVSRMPSNISTPPEKWGPWLYYQCVPEGKEYPVLCRKPALERAGWVKNVTSWFNGGVGKEQVLLDWNEIAEKHGKVGKEQVLLDWNEIAEKHGYVHVGTCRVSPDHRFLAYTLDTTGNELFQLRIKDLRDNSILPQFGVDGVLSLAWAQDSRTLFYTSCDQNQRPYRVSCIKLGSDSADDAPILTEKDSRFCLDITSTKDGKFVTVNSNSRTSSEVYVINTTNPQTELRKFCERVPGVQYFLEHHSDYFYILTNAPTSNKERFSGSGYYLARCRDDDLQLASMQTILMPGEDTFLEDMDMFSGNLVLFLNKNGSPAICSIDMPIDVGHEKHLDINGFNPWSFPLPSSMCTVTPGSNHDFMSSIFRVVLSSPVMPDLLVDYDMSRKLFSIVQQDDVTNVASNHIKYCSQKYGNDPNKALTLSSGKKTNAQKYDSVGWKEFSMKYACEEKEVISHDGVKIPLTILFSHSAYRKGQSPALLHGYGAYGEVLDKSWCPDRLSLLDRGWMFAFADVRGGAGPDPSWHLHGRGLNKLNSIHDFIACGEYLINEGFVHKNQLSAMGISAGCLVVGAAVNMHPELFRAAILKVPFLDVLNTLLDPSLPLTTLDYEEFGDPQTKSYFDYILKYSPHDNIPEGACCPSMLVSASFNDSRVGVWEAAKWVAKIRDTSCSSCSRSVILQTNTTGGHFREGGRFASCKETAYDYAFLIKASELTQNSD